MARITHDTDLDKLVAQIVAVLPQQDEDAVKSFLDARLTSYNKESKVDAHLKTKAGKTYLPYPANVKLVARLYDCVTTSTEDDYDF